MIQPLFNHLNPGHVTTENTSVGKTYEAEDIYFNPGEQKDIFSNVNVRKWSRVLLYIGVDSSEGDGSIDSIDLQNDFSYTIWFGLSPTSAHRRIISPHFEPDGNAANLFAEMPVIAPLMLVRVQYNGVHENVRMRYAQLRLI